MIINILWNYSILVICVAGFRGGAVLDLILPVIQLLLSWFNYSESKKWQTVLMLEFHLLVSTVLGLYLEGYLYLKYISDDMESVLVFQTIWKIGAALVFCFGVITTLLKYVLIKNRTQKKKIEQ